MSSSASTEFPESLQRVVDNVTALGGATEKKELGAQQGIRVYEKDQEWQGGAWQEGAIASKWLCMPLPGRHNTAPSQSPSIAWAHAS